MNIFAAITDNLQTFSAMSADERAVPDVRSLHASIDVGAAARASVAGGRLSVDSAESWGPGLRMIQPPDAERTWRFGDLDSDTLSRMSPRRLCELLVDLSPDVSRALWDFLRMCNPGYEIEVYRSNGTTPYPSAKAALNVFIGQLEEYYGSLKIPIGYLFMGGFMGGALFGELVTDRHGRKPVDLVTPDPASARFRKKEHPERGLINQLYQWQDGKAVDLDGPKICYIPIDPLPGSPYGRALIAPALFSAIFLLGLLHDLRRVVAQQGYPRLDLEVQIDELLKLMPEDKQDNPKEMGQWVKDAIGEIQAYYNQLKPDSAYVHTSAVQVNRPVGAVDSSSLGAVDGLIKALERMLTRALKTMPLMQALDITGSEAQANREWEIYSEGISAIQHLVETLLARLFTVALRVQGLQAVVVVKFAKLRAAERERDARTKKIEQENVAFAYDRGWISQDEAAQQAVGHAADEQQPRRVVSSAGNTPDRQPDPGSNR